MLLLATLLAALPPLGSAVRCAAGVEVDSAPLTAANGSVVVLHLHTDDDHGHNTHLCQSDYSFRLAAPGKPAESEGDLFGNDDTWNREIFFELEGFTAGDGAIVALVTEAGRFPIRQVLVYRPATRATEVVDLRRTFAHRLSAACLAALQVVGTLPGGLVVAPAPGPASGNSGACPSSEKWFLQVRENASGQAILTTPRILSSHAAFSPLERSSARPRD